MKKLICLLLTTLSSLADPITFEWSPVPTATGYRLYTTSGTFETTGTRITVPIPPEAQAYLVAFNSFGESGPTPTLKYHPAIVFLLLEQSDRLGGWNDSWLWELFRMPDVLFVPAMINIPQRLNITAAGVEITTSRGVFLFPLPNREGRKFFRSYVAVNR